MQKYLYRFSPARLAFLFLLYQLPSQAQTLALAQQTKDHEKIQKPAYRLLSEVLSELRAQYKADILFEPKTVEGVRVNPESLNKEQSLEKNLARLLPPLGLLYKKINRTSYTVLVDKNVRVIDAKPIEKGSGLILNREPGPSASEGTSNAMSSASRAVVERVITGTVTDSDSNEPLPGVSVLVKGSQKGTTANADGSYRLSVPDGDVTLVFSFVGYLPQEVSVGNRSQINIALAVDTKHWTKWW